MDLSNSDERNEQMQHSAKTSDSHTGPERSAFDPVTQQHVTFKDKTEHDLKTALDSAVQVPASSINAADTATQGWQSLPKDSKTNILLFPTPPQTTTDLRLTTIRILRQFCAVCIACIIVGVLSPWRNGYVFTGLAVIPVLACYYAVELVKNAHKDLPAIAEKERGSLFAADSVNEGAEWLNAVISHAWGVIDPDILSPLADLLEDIMQQSVPSIVSMIKVKQINQGKVVSVCTSASPALILK